MPETVVNMGPRRTRDGDDVIQRIDSLDDKIDRLTGDVRRIAGAEKQRREASDWVGPAAVGAVAGHFLFGASRDNVSDGEFERFIPALATLGAATWVAGKIDDESSIEINVKAKDVFLAFGFCEALRRLPERQG
jgi:hypothetical protein